MARRTVGGMNSVVFYTATTLTGQLADEQHSLSWLFAVDSAGPDHEAFLSGIGVLVSGSHTYEWVLREEDLIANPDKWPAYYGDRPMVVFTTRDLPVPAGADVRFVRGGVADALPAIRAAAGERDVWVIGGGDLAGQFDDAGALDRLEFTYAPATLPGGMPLLPRRIGPDRLVLRDVQRFGQFAHLSYDLRR